MDILKFSRFLENLKESLDTSDINIKWIDQENRLIGLFMVNANTYQLDFNLTGDTWSYKFYLAKRVNNKIELSPNASGIDTDRYKVLATSKKGLSYLIENKKPNAVVFCALDEDDVKRTEIDGSLLTKRQSIYLNMLEDIPNKYDDYTYEVQDIDKNQIYVVRKKKLDNPDYTLNNIQDYIISM